MIYYVYFGQFLSFDTVKRVSMIKMCSPNPDEISADRRSWSKIPSLNHSHAGKQSSSKHTVRVEQYFQCVPHGSCRQRSSHCGAGFPDHRQHLRTVLLGKIPCRQRITPIKDQIEKESYPGSHLAMY